MYTNQRVMTEDCDTNGDLSCCDRMGKIINGCSCTHFYIGLRTYHGYEVASYRSTCSRPSNTAYYKTLPDSAFYFQNNRLSLNALTGFNGQIKLLECADNTNCFGILLGLYDIGGSGIDPSNKFITIRNSASTPSITSTI